MAAFSRPRSSLLVFAAAKKRKPQASNTRKKKQSPYSSSSSRSRQQDRSTGSKMAAEAIARFKASPKSQEDLEELLFGPLLAEMRGFFEKMSDPRVPDFEEEFEKAAAATSGLSASEAAAVKRAVATAYETAKLMPMQLMSLSADDFETAVGKDKLTERWGTQVQSDGFKQWAARSKLGTVLLKDKPVKYDWLQISYQSFSNTHAGSVSMLPGSTHVSVGFADLSELAAAVSAWGTAYPATPAAPVAPAASGEKQAGREQQPQQQSQLDDSAEDSAEDAGDGPEYALQLLQRAQAVNANTNSSSNPDVGSSGSGNSGDRVSGSGPSVQAPLQWVGYDGSPHAVAKTAVLLEMLQGGAEADAVLQVWFSSCWSHTTKAAFQQALAAVLSGATGSLSSSSAQLQPQAKRPFSVEVLQLLQCWQERPNVPLSKSRSSWLRRVNKTRASIGGLKRKQDRLALARYLFTGELLAADVGSTVMCTLPPGRAMADDESFLETLEFPVLAKQWRTQPPELDVVAAGVAVWRQRISKLSELLRQGAVTAEVRHATIERCSREAIDAIHMLQPTSMSWSNVADYMVLKDYLELAKACSAPATVHFLHSMNWVHETKGASHLDLLVTRCAAVDQDVEELEEAVDGALLSAAGAAKAATHGYYCMLGVDKLLLTDPTVDNPRNIIDFHLHRSYHTAWLQKFMTACRAAVADADPGVVAAMQPLVPRPITDTFHELESVSDDDDETEMKRVGRAHVTVLEPPAYTPFQHTSSTFFAAFVLYGSSCRE